ncbi:MAG: hypothetical protein N3F65_00380 [Nitrososphaeria archaeon]|nr:hypothetical protein [Nitrososphaeria archaeon]
MRHRRIHFSVCGIGFGHASRAAAVIPALESKGWEVSISSYGDGLRYLENIGVRAKPVPGISYGILPESKVSIKMTIYRNLILPVKLLEQIACEINYIDDVDVVISDTRASAILAGKLFRKPVLAILNQFNIRIEYPRYPKLIELLEAATQLVGHIWGLSDKILIADYPPPYTISRQNLVIPENLSDKVEYMGPIIEKLPDDLPSIEELREKYRLRTGEKPVIFYHASGPIYERRVLTRMILPILEKLAGEYEVVATLGGDGVEREFPGLKIFSWVDDPLELIKLSDVVICRSGQTTLAKSLSFGKPVIMIPIPAHGEQLGNAYSVIENGAGILVPQEDLSYESLKDAIQSILKGDFKINAEKYSALIADLNPLEKVISAVEDLALKG